MKELLRTHQSILVQGIEFVELNPYNRDHVVQSLEDGIRKHSFILHAILLCGTKLAAVYSRSKTWILLPRDILCLIIYAQSVFHMAPMTPQDGRNHTEDEDANLDKQDAIDPEITLADDLFDNEEFDDMTDTSSVGTSESFSDLQTPPTQRKIPRTKTPVKVPEETPKNGIKTQFDYLFFHATSHNNVEQQVMVKCGVYSEYNKETNMTLLLICDPATVLGNMDQQQNEDIEEEEENEQDSDTIKKQLAQAAKRINYKLNSLVSFLQVKAQAHITMLHYLHYCPGMIHFIFVDRVRNRVIAPRIVSLHTHNPGQDTEHVHDDHLQPMDVSTTFIKGKVWEMCYCSQQYRDDGYTEVGICSNGVQYWFKEWLEDETGLELRWTKPNLRQARAHYELYTMYLPFVSTQAIAHHNKVLVSLLLDRTPK